MMDEKTKYALDSLRVYLSNQEGRFLTSQLGKFYLTKPKAKGFISKKSVTDHGLAFGLVWISNSRYVDEIQVRKSNIKNTSSSSRESMAVPPTGTKGKGARVQSISPANADEIVSEAQLKESSPSRLLLDADPTSSSGVGYITTFVDNVEEASCTVERLRGVSALAIDIEGDLRLDGRLSLIQVGAEIEEAGDISTEVFVFDIYTCPSIMTEGGLSALFAREGVTKIIHDCSRDAEALWGQFDVSLTSVFDTQVAFSALDSGPDAHRKRGLNAVLEMYASTTNDLKGVVEHREGLWEQRPLPPYLLSYAAQDVAFMLEAHRNMESQLTSVNKMEWVLEKSRMKLCVTETAVLDSDLKPMGLLLGAENGTTKYVFFNSDGSFELSDKPFPVAPPTPEEIAAQQRTASQEEASDLIDLQKLVSILPPHFITAFDTVPLTLRKCATEVVVDVGRKPLVRYLVPVDESGLTPQLTSGNLNCLPVTQYDVDSICANPELGMFSSDNRAGLTSTLHRISRKLNRNGQTIGLTMRIGRMVQGSTEMIADIVSSNRSVLLLGIPGVGKTTLLREYARILASKEKRVEIIDTSNEIAGDGVSPHSSVGSARRMMVNKRSQQHQVMIEAVQNHTPQSIVVDEIGTREEALAAGDISQRGVQIIATAHGTKLNDLLQSTELCGLVGGVHTVVLGDEEARRRGLRSKSARERKQLPVFDTVVELRSHHKWVIYHNIPESVDTLLEGKVNPMFEVRSRDISTGQIRVTKTDVFE